jgi:hypothetical protein
MTRKDFLNVYIDKCLNLNQAEGTTKNTDSAQNRLHTNNSIGLPHFGIRSLDQLKDNKKIKTMFRKNHAINKERACGKTS